MDAKNTILAMPLRNGDSVVELTDFEKEVSRTFAGMLLALSEDLRVAQTIDGLASASERAGYIAGWLGNCLQAASKEREDKLIALARSKSQGI